MDLISYAVAKKYAQSQVADLQTIVDADIKQKLNFSDIEESDINQGAINQGKVLQVNSRGFLGLTKVDDLGTTAEGIGFDNSTTNLEATNVQDAIDAIKTSMKSACFKDTTDKVEKDNTELVESGAVYTAMQILNESFSNSLSQLTTSVENWKGINIVSEGLVIQGDGKPGMAIVSDEFGNIYIVNIGTNNATVKQISSVSDSHISKYWTITSSCFVFSNSEGSKLTLLAIFGKINYSTMTYQAYSNIASMSDLHMHIIDSSNDEHVCYMPYVSVDPRYSCSQASLAWKKNSVTSLLKAYVNNGTLLWAGKVQWEMDESIMETANDGTEIHKIYHSYFYKLGGTGEVTKISSYGGTITFSETPSYIEAYYTGSKNEALETANENEQKINPWFKPWINFL